MSLFATRSKDATRRSLKLGLFDSLYPTYAQKPESESVETCRTPPSQPSAPAPDPA